MGKAGLIGGIVVAIIVASLLAAYAAHHSGSAAPASTTASSTATSPSVAVTAAASPTGSTSTTGITVTATVKEFAQISPELGKICRSPNGETPGQLIKWLLDHHSIYKYKLEEFPSNYTIIWVITGPYKQDMENLVHHIEQMECIIEHGGNPRPFDPLFVVDSQITRKYVHTEIKWINDTAIEVVKKADNKCAYEIIVLHAQVVKGFFDAGRIEASKIHQVPSSVLELCQPYLNETAG